MKQIHLTERDHECFPTGKKRTCAFTAMQLAPIVNELVLFDPGKSHKEIVSVLKLYVDEKRITRDMSQEIRQRLRLHWFGEADENIRFLHSFVEKVNLHGHNAELVTCDRAMMLSIILEVAKQEFKFKYKEQMTKYNENMSKYRAKTISDKPTQPDAWCADKYLEQHREAINQKLWGDENAQYIQSLFFAPSTSIAMFDELLLIADADACHLNWGDTTLYSLYSMSANKNSVLLAHGLQAGNECKRTWSAFFAYCKKIYPHLDTLKRTLISDQDKGLVAAFEQTFDHSAHFCCSTH